MNGFIPISRALFDHYLWKQKRKLSKFEAWIWLIKTARFLVEKEKILIKNRILEISRGQILYSQDKIAVLWGWNKGAVNKFLKLLESDNMIETTNETVITRISICNYDKYNPTQKEIETVLKSDGNGTETQKKSIDEHNNKEDNKENKDNNEYKKTSLSEIKISDYPNLNEDYLKIALSFKELFKKNLMEAGASLVNLDKAKGTWIDDVRLMIESDGYTTDDLREAFKFLQNDVFWKQNILCVSTLRKQMTKIKLKIHGKGRKDNSKGATAQELASMLSEKFEKRRKQDIS